MIKKLFVIFGIMIGASASLTAEAKLFDAEEFYLENGLRVVVVPNHKAPIVKQMLWYKAGSADERIGQGGMAHLLEHLMFRGTKEIGAAEYERLVQINGMNGNAFTSQDFTVYHQEMDISRLELAMFLEADRMAGLEISEKDFELERKIVWQERKQVVENNPAAPFGEAMQRLRWQDHPYARSITGMPEEIENLKLDEIKEFYGKFYAPNNAVLVLSGDIDADAAKKLVKKYYGKVKSKEVSDRLLMPSMKAKTEAKLEMELPEISNVRIYNSWLAPSLNYKKEDVYNLVVFSKLLGEGDNSVLYKKLVEGKKIALSAGSAYDPLGRSVGVFYINAMPKDGVSAEKLQKEIDDLVAVTIARLTPKQVEDTKKKLLAGMVYLKDNPNDAAKIIGQMAASGMSLEEIEEYADSIGQVRFEDVKRSAKEVFDSRSKVSGFLKPETRGM